jgi:hypothetical protein
MRNVSMFRIKEGEPKGWWENGGKPKYTYQFFNDEYKEKYKNGYFSGQLLSNSNYDKAKKEVWWCGLKMEVYITNYVIKGKVRF